MKYIDAEKIKAEIERRLERYDLHYTSAGVEVKGLLSLIDSLQQERQEDVVSTANALLEALSKTPYNNRPITDAQIIVKQLLLFFENPKEYNPDAILEQPEMDLEKFSEKIKTFQGRYKHPKIVSVSIKGAMAFMARMFYQYPNVARQWYEQLPKATMD